IWIAEYFAGDDHPAAFWGGAADRCDVWFVVSARCARLRVLHGLGTWLRHFLVVSRSTHSAPAGGAQAAGLVGGPSWRGVWLAGRPHTLRTDSWRDVRDCGPPLGTPFHSIGSAQSGGRRTRCSHPAVARLGSRRGMLWWHHC